MRGDFTDVELSGSRGGRRARARAAACAVASLVAIGVVAGCAATVSTHLDASPSTPAAPVSSPRATLEVPAPLDGEVARALAEGDPLQVSSTSSGSTEIGLDYVVDAVCVARDATTRATYELFVGADAVSGGAIACDGSIHRNTGMTGTGQGVRLEFDPPAEATQAYARVVPSAP
ncbi:hypothetical protein LJR045_002352 [Microbacterium sp. LjRoot45]|uniref:hypothetical protein n=1 Tax=Microbacterium sp. LjRoot45 TaxID=3342329 RepID=UPI003ECE14EE